MSKKVTIPTDGGNPFVVILGGVKYVYKPGETVEVPDGVALEIEEWERWKDKYHGAVQPHFASGGGGADWSQNDPNAPDYVKNRTHWVEENVLFDGKVFSPDIGFVEVDIPSIDLSSGKIYTIILDGVTYVCETAQHADYGFWYLGSFLYEEENPEFPFFFDGIELVMSSGTHAVRIIDETQNVIFDEEVTIDKEVYWHIEPTYVNLKLGETYTVVYDGVNYACEPKADGDAYYSYLGADVFVGGNDFGEFPFSCGNGMDGFVVATRESGTHTIKILSESVHKLDKKFLPDDVGGGGGSVDVILTFTSTGHNTQGTSDKTYDEVMAELGDRPLSALKVNLIIDDNTYTPIRVSASSGRIIAYYLHHATVSQTQTLYYAQASLISYNGTQVSFSNNYKFTGTSA